MVTAQAVVSDVGAGLDWVAVLGNGRGPSTASAMTFGAPGAESRVEIEGAVGGSLSSSTAQARSCGVLFDGVLYNRRDLAETLALPLNGTGNAALVLGAYERWGVELTRHIKGIFALVIWDGSKGQMLAVRDPLGSYPLFYAAGTAGRLLVSTSIDALVRHPAVDGAVNRAALADHLCRRWPYPSETFYSSVKRLPPGCRMLVTRGGTRIDRYWDPAPPGEPVNWITEEELESFDERLETAVERASSQGRAGIFLSGGLDSISIAAVAADVARRSGRPLPVSLSLGFADAECNEEHIQRGVAASLGMEQEFIPFAEATPSQGLLAAALDNTRRSGCPMFNTWSPAYTELALRGKRRGVEAILSGAGGDEWLTITPVLVADLIRGRDVAGLWSLLGSWQRSYQLSPLSMLRNNLWTFGVRPLAGVALHRMAPGAWHANRLARLRRQTPSWVAPDAALRKELDCRTEDALTPAAPVDGFYLQGMRAGLNHPLTCMELEETFERGRRLDMKFLQPYWDADVVDMLYRTPPQLLNRHGRAKGLVRATVARRFPALALDRQKKVSGTSFLKSVFRKELPNLWRGSGGAGTLAAMGIIDARKTKEVVEGSLSKVSGEALGRTWDLLNLEVWAQARATGSATTRKREE